MTPKADISIAYHARRGENPDGGKATCSLVSQHNSAFCCGSGCCADQ
jgi:hypothetical protein